MAFVIERKNPHTARVEYAKGRSRYHTMGWVADMQKARVFLRKADASNSYAIKDSGDPKIVEVAIIKR